MQPLAREHPIAHRKSLPWRWHGQRRRKNFLTQRSFCHQLRGNIFNRFQVTCEVHKHTRDSVDCYRCWWIRDIHHDLATCPIMRHGSRRWHEVPYSPKLRDDFCTFADGDYHGQRYRSIYVARPGENAHQRVTILPKHSASTVGNVFLLPTLPKSTTKRTTQLLFALVQDFKWHMYSFSCSEKPQPTGGEKRTQLSFL